MAAVLMVRATPGSRRRVPAAAAVATVALGLSLAMAGCGGGGRHTAARTRPSATRALPAPCSSRSRRALARSAGIAVDLVASSPFTTSSGAASCRFSTRPSAAGRLDVVAELDSAPQAYYRLEREVVEFGQNVIWGHLGRRAYPVAIAHLGLDADWIPAENELVTSDGVRLVTIVVDSVPASAGGGARVAASLARSYLGPLVSP
jgi:hypothetical protein